MDVKESKIGGFFFKPFIEESKHLAYTTFQKTPKAPK